MSDILKPKRQYKKKQTKEEIIEEYKGGFIDEPIYNDPVGVDELVEEEEKQYPKADEELMKPARRKRGALKGQLSDKLKESLANGRQKLQEKWQQDRIKNKELSDMYAIKRANKLIKQQMTLKQKMHCGDLDDEPEEPIKIIQPKKPKKKQTIILEAVSDSEEEIIYKKESKPKKQPVILNNVEKKIIFF